MQSYSVTKGQQAIRELARAMRDRTGNLPPLYGIFPDYSAPIVRNQPEGRELMMARWGMPSPVFAAAGQDIRFGGHQCPQRQSAAGRHPSAGLVRLRRDPAVGLLCRHLDALDLRPESEGRRNNK